MSAVKRRAEHTVTTVLPSEQHTRAELRRRLTDVADAIIALLDALDGDPDGEPYLAGFQAGFGDDREDESEPDEADASDEPSLGWPNPMGENMDAPRNMPRIPPWGSPHDDRELDEAEGRLEDAGDEREADADLE